MPTLAGVIYESIEYTQASQYAKDHGFAESQDDLDEFIYLIHRLDSVYLEWVRGQQGTS